VAMNEARAIDCSCPLYAIVARGLVSASAR
jgi:hypothetical protein